jgi:hypothetical protein
MFGYVKPHTPELLVKEHAFYKSVYCGLCHELKKKSLFLPFTLSYDFVFLAILRLYVSGESVKISHRRCMVHPFKKRPYLTSSAALDYSARASAMLLYRNIEDDVRDSKGFKKLASGILLSMAKRIYKKNPVDEKLDLTVVEKLEEICKYENERTSDVYACANAFGEILASVVSFGIEDPAVARPLYEIGFHIGRWIYLVDAVDDVKKDKKSGSYNPFIAAKEDEKDDFIEKTDFSLAIDLSDADLALELLPAGDKGLYNILKNIIGKGMPNVVKRILYPEDKEKYNEDELSSINQ